MAGIIRFGKRQDVYDGISQMWEREPSKKVNFGEEYILKFSDSVDGVVRNRSDELSELLEKHGLRYRLMSDHDHRAVRGMDGTGL